MKLTKLEDDIDKIFEQWSTNDSPGMAIAVEKEGKSIHKKAYGMADLDHGIPNTPDTVFHCASLAKQFTAMSILLLCQWTKPNGRPFLDLDDDVRDYIHQLDRKYIPKITIRQLLHHTSGIRDMLIQLTLAGWRWGDDAMTRNDVLGLASRMKTVNFTPGTKYAYSNTNYFLAGEIVRNVSGQTLAEFAEENIFDRLKMKSTRFVDSYCETVKNRAYGYRRVGHDVAEMMASRAMGEYARGQIFEKRIPNYDLTGPTNLFTTVGDLMLWDKNFDSGEVGGPDAIAALQRPVKTSNAYGLGLFVLRDNNDTPQKIYHNGRTIGYRAHLFRDYQQKISIALLCNVEFTNVEATDDLVFAVSQAVQEKGPFRPMIDQADLRNPPGTTPAEALKKYCGTYYSSEIDATLEVESNGSSLEIKRPGSPAQPLLDFPGFPENKFVARDFTEVLREIEVTFRRDGDGNITDCQLDWSRRIGGSRLMDFRFARR